jgi:hypothetical protein
MTTTAGATMTTKTNKYAATCVACDQRVPAGTGILGRDGDKWIVTHPAGTCPTLTGGRPHAPGCTEDAAHVGDYCITRTNGVRASTPRTGRAAPAALPTVPAFAPTAEQEYALALYATGESMVIEACAGAGKTSTLLLLAASNPRLRVQYTAFNRKIVDETGAKLPSNASARNVHQLAFAGIGSRYSHRLKASNRMSSDRIASILQIDPIYVGDGDARRALAPGFLAGQVMKALKKFCQSADQAPTVRHFAPIDGVDHLNADGTRNYDTSNMIARTLLPKLEQAWADTLNVNGVLPFGHNYIKIWELNSPRIAADVIMFDEAQDASPVLASIIAQQTHAQRIYVGDSAQAIYGFTGAIDAIAGMKAEGLKTATLSQSFRFGPAIAARANVILTELKADLRCVGFDQVHSTVGVFPEGMEADAVLTRTNAAAIECLLTARTTGTKAHVVNIGAQMLAFARAARDLDEKGHTSYGDLAGFTSWADVVKYAEEDALGEDLQLNVKLVEKFTAQVIIEAIEDMPSEADADLTISTAHQSKGREWDTVRIAGDFVPQTKPGEEPPAPSEDELRLRYVAITRAKLHLDCSVLNEQGTVAA